MMKDKKVVGIIAGVVVLLLVIGGVFLFKGKKQDEAPSTDDTQAQTIPSLSKSDLDLSMALSPDNKKVKFSIGKASDIKHIEYELTYDADSEEDASVRVPKGITGDEDISGSTFQTDFLDLGTCSKNICRYDTGVQEVKLLAKITKKDGKVYQATDSISIK